MEKTVKRILRSSDVELKGQIRLDAMTQQNQTVRQNTTASSPAAKIIENAPDFAIIELTCSCGMKTQIKCQYTAQGG